MSSGGGGGNPLNKFAKGLEYNVRDVGSGVSNIASGRDVSGGLWDLLRTSAAIPTGGLSNYALPPGSNQQQDMTNDASAQAQKDAEQLAKDQEMARRDAIRKRLDTAVAMRSRSPGSSQTLLTVPDVSNGYSDKTPTLLTGR